MGCALALPMGNCNFRPPQNPHPSTNHQKFGTGDYIGGPCSCAKFGANPPMGGFWVKYSKKFFLFRFFSASNLQVRPFNGFSRLIAQTTRTRARVCILGFR